MDTSRTFTDANLNVKLESEFNQKQKTDEIVKKKIDSLKHPKILAIYTVVGGYAIMLNHYTKKLVFPFINVRVHDSVCAMAVANVGGVISTIIRATMYYRLHGNNICGVSERGLLKKLLSPLDSYKRNIRMYYIWKTYDVSNELIGFFFSLLLLYGCIIRRIISLETLLVIFLFRCTFGNIAYVGVLHGFCCQFDTFNLTQNC